MADSPTDEVPKQKKPRGGKRVQRAIAAAERHRAAAVARGEDASHIGRRHSSSSKVVEQKRVPTEPKHPPPQLRLRPPEPKSPPKAHLRQRYSQAESSSRSAYEPRLPEHSASSSAMLQSLKRTLEPAPKYGSDKSIVTQTSSTRRAADRHQLLVPKAHAHRRRASSPSFEASDFPPLSGEEEEPRSPVALGESFSRLYSEVASDASEILEVKQVPHRLITIDLHNVLDATHDGLLDTEMLNLFYRCYQKHIKVIVLSYIGLSGEKSAQRRRDAQFFVENANHRLHRRYANMGSEFLKLMICETRVGEGGKAAIMKEIGSMAHIDDHNGIVREIRREEGLWCYAVTTKHEKHLNLKGVDVYPCVRGAVEAFLLDFTMKKYKDIKPDAIPQPKSRSQPGHSASSDYHRSVERHTESPSSSRAVHLSAIDEEVTPGDRKRRKRNIYSPHESSDPDKNLPSRQDSQSSSSQDLNRTYFWPRPDGSVLRWSPKHQTDLAVARIWMRFLNSRPGLSVESDQKSEYFRWVTSQSERMETMTQSSGGNLNQ